MNQGGRGQRAGPLRSRPEVEPDGVSCGASGAAPRDGTVSQSSNVRSVRRSISLDGIRTRSADVPITRDGRTRWTIEENTLIMRVHYIAIELQATSGRTYRDLLTSTWNEINPERHSYPNLLANRVRWIMEHEKFSSVELEAIKRSIRPFAPPPSDETNYTEVEQPEIENQETTQLENLFKKNMQLYTKISPQNRPKIPRLKGSRNIHESVKEVNKIIKSTLKRNSTLEEVVDCVFAGAVTVCQENKIHITSRQPKPKEDKEPPWKQRLEKKINTIRKQIGKLHTYLNTNSPSRKTSKKVARIASEFRIKSIGERFKQDLTKLCDTLKQKVKALDNLKEQQQPRKNFRHRKTCMRHGRKYGVTKWNMMMKPLGSGKRRRKRRNMPWKKSP
ncbi:uncharacterized protein LOC123313353 [Coccinella septempunctata]|uniref:uncharacterized protein LOC123313353 n=1 Tax=Coccinella septempunctata TaxID=41139 RepID=UPI001D07276F|nr:uncharacterized protein LOC123313353 [Coccinella septempunctata]